MVMPLRKAMQNHYRDEVNDSADEYNNTNNSRINKNKATASKYFE